MSKNKSLNNHVKNLTELKIPEVKQETTCIEPSFNNEVKTLNAKTRTKKSKEPKKEVPQVNNMDDSEMTVGDVILILLLIVEILIAFSKSDENFEEVCDRFIANNKH